LFPNNWNVHYLFLCCMLVAEVLTEVLTGFLSDLNLLSGLWSMSFNSFFSLLSTFSLSTQIVFSPSKTYAIIVGRSYPLSKPRLIVLPAQNVLGSSTI
jgi:hypothetical protein